MSHPEEEYLGSAPDSALAKEKPFSEEVLRGKASPHSHTDRCLNTSRLLLPGGVAGGSCIRGLVSKKKKRYSENGFNLDLSYVTDRIIAMGYPSTGTESCYRNPMSETKRFMEQIHGLPHVKVYNLCCEREYPSEHFGGRVEIYPFPDHNAPPFEMIRPMCLSVEKWLDEHPKNVVAIHCKAGKGRTGVMVCALLLHGGLFLKASDAMNYYARARTIDTKGLTIPSQIRYVEYYETLLQHGRMLCPQLRINHVRFNGLLPGRTSLIVIVRNNRRNHETPPVSRTADLESFISVPLGVAVAGDVKFEVFRVNIFGRVKPFCHFWVHTAFMEYGTIGASGNDTIIKKVGLDKLNKDKLNRVVAGEFSVSINADLVSIASRLLSYFCSASLTPDPDIFQLAPHTLRRIRHHKLVVPARHRNRAPARSRFSNRRTCHPFAPGAHAGPVRVRTHGTRPPHR